MVGRRRGIRWWERRRGRRYLHVGDVVVVPKKGKGVLACFYCWGLADGGGSPRRGLYIVTGGGREEKQRRERAAYTTRAFCEEDLIPPFEVLKWIRRREL